MSEVTPIVDDQEMLRAYAETIKLKDAEIERLKLLLRVCVTIFEKGVPITTDFIAELRKAAQ